MRGLTTWPFEFVCEPPEMQRFSQWTYGTAVGRDGAEATDHDTVAEESLKSVASDTSVVLLAYWHRVI